MTALRERADGRSTTRTRDFYTEALREYARLHGSVTAACFSPGAAKRGGRPDLVERYYSPRPSGGSWPSLNAIKGAFGGSFGAALDAAGIPRNSTGPASGRRRAGEAEPILNVRERLVYVPDARLDAATRRARRAEERAERAAARADRLAAEVRALRARAPEVRERVVRERVPVEQPRTITKTRTRVEKRTVRVPDGRTVRALERARERLAEAEGARREAEARLDAVQGELRAAKAEAADSAVSRDEATRTALEAARERDRASDRLAAAEALRTRQAEELAEARAASLGAVEAAAASDLVRRAESRAEAAEVRAARAEREMAEQGAAVTGELRRLTKDELEDLRRSGPAGPVVLARALRRLASARRSGSAIALDEALVEVLRAAATWRDRLGGR